MIAAILSTITVFSSFGDVSAMNLEANQVMVQLEREWGIRATKDETIHLFDDIQEYREFSGDGVAIMANPDTAMLKIRSRVTKIWVDQVVKVGIQAEWLKMGMVLSSGGNFAKASCRHKKFSTRKVLTNQSPFVTDSSALIEYMKAESPDVLRNIFVATSGGDMPHKDWLLLMLNGAEPWVQNKC